MADTTVTAGRGVIYIALAKAYFMVAGYAIYFTLPRLLGSEVLWGNYVLVVGLVSVIDNVIVTGTIQGVSKFTVQDDTLADGIKRAALKVQLFLGGGIALLYIISAPFIARWERDPGLTHLYQLSAGIMFCYSFYAVFVGSLNGLRQFGRQASLDTGFATLKAILILGGAAATGKVFGALAGFVSAAAIILIASSIWVGWPKQSQPFAGRLILQFMLQLFLYTLCLNLIMRTDLFLLKRIIGEMTSAAQAGSQALIASAYAGYYGTAQSLAFIPYQAILAIAFVIFPLVSRSTFDEDLTTTQIYIRQTLRFSLIFAAGLAVVFMANPAAVIHVPYPEKYRIGSSALRILAAGMVCFSMFTIINTILNSSGRTKTTICSGVVTFIVTAIANATLIPKAGSPQAALEVAAWVTSGAVLFGALLSTLFLYHEFSAAFPVLTVVRTLIAMGVAITLGHFIPEVSKIVTLGECFLVLIVFYLTLIILGEFQPADLAKFKQVFSRRR